MAYNVLLYEVNRLMLGTLSKVINQSSGYNLVASYQHHVDAIGQGRVFNPNLLLIDVDVHNDIGMVGEFRDAFPNAVILCMGERWQADSARLLVQAGANGYILKPFTEADLDKAIETFGKGGSDHVCKVLTFFSPKGKSGKTTLIANLAMSLGRKTGEAVGVIDADLQFGDMSVFLNLDPQSTIVEATRDMEFLSPLSLKNYYMPVTENVSVLCGTKKPSFIDKVSMEGFEALVTMSKSLFSYLLIDVPAGFNPTSIAAAEMADYTYIVAMDNGGFEIQHMRKAIDLFKEDWSDVDTRLKAVFTRMNSSKQPELEAALDFPIEGIIPNEYLLVSNAANNGRMALDIAADSPLSTAIGNLAVKLIHSHQIRWNMS